MWREKRSRKVRRAPPEPCEVYLIEPACNRWEPCAWPTGFLLTPEEWKACTGLETQAPAIRELVQIANAHHVLRRVLRSLFLSVRRLDVSFEAIDQLFRLSFPPADAGFPFLAIAGELIRDVQCGEDRDLRRIPGRHLRRDLAHPVVDNSGELR